MTKGERVRAALAGRPVDRVPVSFWRHFPDIDLDPLALAGALVRFHTRFDLDFIKVMPNGVYCVEDWGCRIAYQGGSSGARTCTRHAVQRIEDWSRLAPLDPQAGALGRELTCLRAVCAGRGDDAPVLQTVFSPFTVARKVAGADLVQETMRREPAQLHAALRQIASTVSGYARACIAAGAQGIFFASQAATPEVVPMEEYRTFVEPYDLDVLRALRGTDAIILVHLHGDRPYLPYVASTYPAGALNWHDRRTRPTLAEAKAQVAQALVGGLDERGSMIAATPAEIRAQALEAIAQCGGRRFLLGPGCVVDLNVPEANLAAAREAVEVGSRP
jgi:uroporphyrinogen decarboxylase